MQKRFLQFLPFLILGSIFGFIGSCLSHYQLAHRSFNSGNEYYQKGRTSKTLREYNRVLDILNTYPHHPAANLLRAILYHRFYLMNLPDLWKESSDSYRNKYPVLASLLKIYTTKDKFLTDAFGLIIALKNEQADIYTKHTENWLLIEKDIVIGDYLIYLLNETNALISHSIPTKFSQQIRRYAFYETARHFYLRGWLEMMVTLHHKPTINLDTVWNMAWERLKQTYHELLITSTLLGYSDRSEEFKNIFLEKSHYYTEIIHKLELRHRDWQFFSSKENISSIVRQQRNEFFSAEHVLKNLGISLLPEYLSLDEENYIKEARRQISQAIEATLHHKYTLAFQYLLEAFQHTILAHTLAWQDRLGNCQLLENLTTDIYFYLDKLSK